MRCLGKRLLIDMDITGIEANSLRRRTRAEESVSQLHVTFLGFAIAAAAIAWLVASLYRSHAGVHAVDASILLPVYRADLAPKPVERFTFLLLASAIPVSAFLFVLLGCGCRFRWSSVALSTTVVAAVAAAFFVPFAQFGFDSSLLTGVVPTGEHPLLLLFGAVVVAVLVCAIPVDARARNAKRSASLIALVLFVASVGLQLVAWRILNVNSITENPTWSTSVDAVIYSVSQVVGGRTLLADLPSQYGLFPEFVGPLFRLVGLSVFTFSVLFAAMQVASLVAVYSVAQRLLRHPLFKIGFGIALVMVTYETCLFMVGIREQYFQYWPIRFFWPALSLLAFYSYAQMPTLRRAVFMSLIGAVASLWNADSGLMVEAAFGVFLVAKWAALFSRDKEGSRVERHAIVLKVWLHLAIFAIAIAVMALYLWTKADRPLQLTWLVDYQKLFYGLGFMMLPLPLSASPWMAVLGVYLLGVLSAASSWRKSPRNRSADVLLYTCMLGTGLFVYYEGRSHILNLITVSWPALLAASLMSDRAIRATAAGILNRSFLAPAAISGGVMLLCCVAFIRGIPMLADSARSAIVERSVPASPVVHDEIEFISLHTREGEACVILSKRQGLYYASLHLVSPLIGPGNAETLTVRDRDSMITQLRDNEFACVFVGQGGSAPDLGIDISSDLPSYRVVRSNALQTMVQLAPK